MVECQNCGASLKEGARRCIKCASPIEVVPSPALVSVGSHAAGCSPMAYTSPMASPQGQMVAGQPQVIVIQQPAEQAAGKRKSKSTAILLAFFFGGIGVHKFYLDQYIQGALYLCFCWTFIPVGLGILEALCYSSMTDKFFADRYCR